MNLALTADSKSFVTVLLYFALSPAAPLGRLATIAVAALFRDTHLQRSASQVLQLRCSTYPQYTHNLNAGKVCSVSYIYLLMVIVHTM